MIFLKKDNNLLNDYAILNLHHLSMILWCKFIFLTKYDFKLKMFVSEYLNLSLNL